MSLLDGITVNTDVKAETKDVIGGYQPLPTNLYPVKCGLIHLGKSPKGAVNFNFVGIKTDGTEYRETIYITNAKGSPTYTNKDGTFYLPGWTRADNICIAATGKGLLDQTRAMRSIELYNRTANKKLVTEVEALPDLIDKPIILGIERVLENKSKNVGTPEAAKYVKTPEIRTFNEITAVFHTNEMTVIENADPSITEAEFIKTWRERKVGKDTNKVVTVKENPAAAKPTSAIVFDDPSEPAKPAETKSVPTPPAEVTNPVQVAQEAAEPTPKATDSGDDTSSDLSFT